jgi:hypothetical protein
MADVDVMVPRDLADHALESLRADGWQVALPGDERSIDELLRTRHAVRLRRGGDDLQLHWSAVSTRVRTDLDGELWDASVQMDIGGQRTRGLAPADQLLHTFAQGLRYDPLTPFPWVADAHVVISSSRGAVDWDQLFRRTERYQLSPSVAAAIGYLDARFPGLMPPPAIAAARSLPVTPRERRDFEHGTRAGSRWLPGAWRAYRRRVTDPGGRRPSDAAAVAAQMEPNRR